MSLLHIALLPVCAGLDRLRGMGAVSPIVRGAALLAYGLTLGYYLGLGMDGWQIAALAGLWAVGEHLVGWGNAIGPALHGERPNKHKLHWYQVGLVARSAWLSLAVRGFLWGAPCLALYPWWHKVAALPIAAAIAMPLAIWMVLWFTPPVRRIDSTAGEEWVAESKRSSRMWAAQEIVRGFLIGLFTLLIAGGIR